MRSEGGTVIAQSNMSALSNRDHPPSENGFSLPPISLKMTPSPNQASETDIDMDEEEESGYRAEPQSSYSSRASSFMYSRRSSRISQNSSATSSPTKLPTIDWHKTNSAASFASSRSTNTRRSFREVKTDRMERGSLCKSPSWPMLQRDEYEESTNSSVNGDIQVSLHPSTMKQYSGDDMHLPNIFSSKQQTRRDTSLPPLASGEALATPRFMDANKEPVKTRRSRRDAADSDQKYANQPGNSKQDMVTPRTEKPHSNGGFLVPISESDKVTSKSKAKRRQKGSPKEKHGTQEETDNRHANGITGLLQIDDRPALPSVTTRHKWNIQEEDETVDNASNASFDETLAIEKIAKENSVSDSSSGSEKKSKKNGSKNKK